MTGAALGKSASGDRFCAGCHARPLSKNQGFLSVPQGSTNMTSRERLQRTFRRQAVDRVPVAPFLYYNNVYEMFGYEPSIDDFFDPPDFDPMRKFLDYCARFGFDALHTLGSVWDAYTMDKPGENWDVHITREGSADSQCRTLTIQTPGGELRQVENFRRNSRFLIVSAIDEYLIKTRQDFEIFARYAPPAEGVDCRLVRRAKEAIGEAGLTVGLHPWGIQRVEYVSQAGRSHDRPVYGRALLSRHDGVLS